MELCNLLHETLKMAVVIGQRCPKVQYKQCLIFTSAVVAQKNIAMAQYHALRITFLLFTLWFQPPSSFIFTCNSD